ncbi:uncharacterized protein LOC123674580 [Harmonia axyridis]|uniref:uncharacterized protein LOC123674580 n=1 Tax=Harmonia axyridis TaxID=115357 RepID=UPI001E276663|nr:uncharacterized protein LOC123674580 [Harmonia axyridis]
MPVKMNDPGYDFECSRAELLGIAPPSYDEYLKNVADNVEISKKEDETEEIETSEYVKNDDENSKVAAGRKLDEINNILQSTQEKLHRFKASYGSFTNVLKTKLGKSLDISFSQSETDGSQTIDETTLNPNTDKSEEEIIGSVVNDNDKDIGSNGMRQNGQSADISNSGKEDDETAYKEIELNDTQVKSPEVKKFLNFSFLNLGGK